MKPCYKGTVFVFYDEFGPMIFDAFMALLSSLVWFFAEVMFDDAMTLLPDDENCEQLHFSALLLNFFFFHFSFVL